MRYLLAAAVASLVVAAPVAAQITTYSSQSAFVAAHPGLALSTFTSLAQGQNVGATVTLGGVTFSNPDTFGTIAAPNPFLPSGFIYSGDMTTGANNSVAATTISYGGGSFGLLIAAAAGGTLQYTINGAAGSVRVAPFGSAFLGFDTFAATSTLIFAPVATQIGYGEVITSVPEAATWTTMVLGLGLLGGALRRRRALVARITYA